MKSEETQEILRQVLSCSKADEAEVFFEEEIEGLTRFANNQIEQNINTKNTSFSIRSISGQKSGRAWTNILDKDSLEKMVKTSEELIQVQPEDKELLSLPGPQEYREQANYVEATAKCGPKERAKILGDVFAQSRANGSIKAAGIVSASDHALAIANTNGLFAYDRKTESTLRLTIMTQESSGFSQDLNKDISKLNIERVADVAIEKALSSRGPKEIPPGEYTVILESQAVADLVIFLSHLAFGALAYQEGRSFLSGKLGKKLFGHNINLSDDAYHEQSLGLPFDFEGMPRQRVTLIENGVAKNTVHSRKTAKRTRVKTTGHGLPEPNTTGPIPLNPVLSPGNESLEEMIAGTKKGILITQLHYTNVINPMELILTGMTRNGIFMIEKGKIAYPVKNMRFTDSLARIFNQVEAIGCDLIRIGGFFGGGAIVPALKINNFTFSSTTSF